MLASLGGDEPTRKENVHSNRVAAAKPAKTEKQNVNLEPKVSQPKLHQASRLNQESQPANSPLKHINKSRDKEVQLLKSPTTTPSAPLSSIKINLPDVSSSTSEESARRELFQSPLSSVSSTAADSERSASSESSALSPVDDASVYKTRISTDSRSIVSEDDGGYDSSGQSNSVSDSDSDESNRSGSESNSYASCDKSMISEESAGSEEIIPEHEYEEDEDYSIEMEESEDELEFDEESEDGGGKRGRPKGKSVKKAQKNKRDDVKSAEKAEKGKSKSTGKKPAETKESKSKSADKSNEKGISESSDDESVDSRQSEADVKETGSVNNESRISEDDRDTNDCCDFDEEPSEEPAQPAPNEPPKEMASYISTLQHTQIKTTKSSSKRFTKISSKNKPTTSQILSVVDQLFGMIEDINTVTVGDIVHSVAEHFGIKVNKETKKAIKMRLTELICAKAAGVEAAKPSISNESPKEQTKPKPRRRTATKKHQEEKQVDEAAVSKEPSDSDVIALVDQLFKATHGDTVYFSDILGSVASHFGISKVKKETKTLIRTRFVELMDTDESTEAVVVATAEQQSENEVEKSASEDGAAKELMADQEPRQATVVDIINISSTENAVASDQENDNESNISFGEVDTSFDVDCDDHVNEHRAHAASPTDSNRLDEPNATISRSHNQESVGVISNAVQTPQISKSMKCPESLIASVDSRDKSLAGENLKCNDSFMSCETTLFKNLSPECMKTTNDSVDKLMSSLSISDSLSSMSESRRVEKGQWSLGKEIGSGSFGVVHVGMNAIDGSKYCVRHFNCCLDDKSKSRFVLNLQL